MSSSESTLDDSGSKPGKKGLIIGLIGAMLAGGGGFYAVSSGLVLGTDAGVEDTRKVADFDQAVPDVAFVPVEPLVVSLPPGSGAKHLRFRAELEVPGGGAAAVTDLMPRVVDVLNAYLRAVEPKLLQEPDALTRLRAQMLRRVQLVVGEGRVSDLLVMEFVLT